MVLGTGFEPVFGAFRRRCLRRFLWNINDFAASRGELVRQICCLFVVLLSQRNAPSGRARKQAFPPYENKS